MRRFGCCYVRRVANAEFDFFWHLWNYVWVDTRIQADINRYTVVWLQGSSRSILDFVHFCLTVFGFLLVLKNFLYRFSIICVFWILRKFTLNVNKYLEIELDFTNNHSKIFSKIFKFFPYIPKILFKIHFKSPINIIQDLSKIP